MPRIVQFKEEDPTSIFSQIARDRLIRQQNAKEAYATDLQRQRLEQSRAYNEWLMGRDDARAAESEAARVYGRGTQEIIAQDRAKAANEEQRLITGRSYHIQEENNRTFQVHFDDALALIDDARADGARHVRALKDAGISNPTWNGVDSFKDFVQKNQDVSPTTINQPEVSDAVDGYLLHLIAIESGKKSLFAMRPHGATIKNNVWKFFPKHDLRNFYFTEWGRGGREGKESGVPVVFPPEISAQINEVQEQVGPQGLARQPEAPAPAAVVDPGPSPLDVYKEQYDAGAREQDPAFDAGGPINVSTIPGEPQSQFRQWVQPEPSRYTGPALAPIETSSYSGAPSKVQFDEYGRMVGPTLPPPEVDAIGPTMLPDVNLSDGAEGYEVVPQTMDEALLPYISQSPYYDRWRESQAPEEVVVTDEEIPWDAVHPDTGQPINPEIWESEIGEGYPEGLTPQWGYDAPMQGVPVMAPEVLPTEYPPVEGQFAYTGAPSALGGIESEEGYGRDAYMPTSQEVDAAWIPEPPEPGAGPMMSAYEAPRFPVGRADLSIPYYADRLWGGIKDFNEKYIGFNPNIGGRMPSDVEWDESGVPVTGKTVWDLGLVLSALYTPVGVTRSAIGAAVKPPGWLRTVPAAEAGAYSPLMNLVKSAPPVVRLKLDKIIKSINSGKRSIDEIRKVDHPRIWKILKSIPGTAQRSRSVASKKGAETTAILKKEAEDILKAAKEAFDAGAFPTGGVLP